MMRGFFLPLGVKSILQMKVGEIFSTTESLLQMLFIITLFVAGMILVVLSIRQIIFRRKFLRAGVNGAIGASLLIGAAFFSLLLLNLQTYVQLTKEIQLAELSVGKGTVEGTPLTLIINGNQHTYLISSNEWRIDARFLKWKPWAAVLGKEPVVRLESLSGRIKQHRDKPERVYQLHSDYKQLEELLSYLTMRFGMVDTLYGSSVYMPTKEGARYQISATHSGLVARPVNEQGREAIYNWGKQ